MEGTHKYKSEQGQQNFRNVKESFFLGSWSLERPLCFIGKTTLRVCDTSLESVFGGRYQKDRKKSRTSKKNPLWVRRARL